MIGWLDRRLVCVVIGHAEHELIKLAHSVPEDNSRRYYKESVCVRCGKKFIETGKEIVYGSATAWWPD